MMIDIQKPGLAVSLGVQSAAFLSFLVAFSSPDWAERTREPQKFGLWRACTDANLTAGLDGTCTTFSESKLRWFWLNPDIESDPDLAVPNMSFVQTTQVFACIALFFLIVATACYAACFFKYHDWFIAMACGFQFFAGIMIITASIEWSNKEVAESLGWAYYTAIISATIFILNGLIYIIVVCTGVCYIRPYTGGIVLRGEAEKERIRKKREQRVT